MQEVIYFDCKIQKFTNSTTAVVSDKLISIFYCFP